MAENSPPEIVPSRSVCPLHRRLQRVLWLVIAALGLLTTLAYAAPNSLRAALHRLPASWFSADATCERGAPCEGPCAIPPLDMLSLPAKAPDEANR